MLLSGNVRYEHFAVGEKFQTTILLELKHFKSQG